MPSIAYAEDFTIRTYEIDNRKQATVPALVRLMQEAAMQNVIRMKLSVWDLEPHAISWVLMRKHLWIDRLPRLGEKIRIRTSPTGFERLFTYRDYLVFDEAGKRLAGSSSTWLLMNTQTRRMARIPDFILAHRENMPPPEEWLPRPADRLPAPQNVSKRRSFTVNWHDLDFNLHLNNTLYIQWLLEATDDDLLQNGRLRELEVHYRAEALWHDRITAEAGHESADVLRHRLVREEDGKELAIGRTTWVMGDE